MGDDSTLSLISASSAEPSKGSILSLSKDAALATNRCKPAPFDKPRMLAYKFSPKSEYTHKTRPYAPVSAR